MTTLESGRTKVGATGDELREVAAYLQGVADAAAAFHEAQQQRPRTLVDTKPCPSVWLTGTEPSQIEPTADPPHLGLCAAVPLQPAVASRRTLPYGATLVSLPSYPSSHAPMSYPAPWSQRGGARLIDLDAVDSPVELYAALDERRCTLLFPHGAIPASDVPGTSLTPDSACPEIEPNFWESERHSAIKLRVPQLPPEWNALTGSED